MMHVCGALFMFFHGDRFMNPGADPACPAGGLSLWSTRQGGGVLREEIVETEGKITALDGADVHHEEVTSATRVNLAVVMRPRTTSTKTVTLAFASHSIFGAQCPMVEAILPLIDWIDKNRSKWGRIMEGAEATTLFVYDMSWVVGRYINACILASSAASQGDPGARTPCLFQFIFAKLDHGRYAGRQLPTSLQGLLSVWAR